MLKNYFPHDSNARNDQKILCVREKFGMQGYGLFWCILETMAEDSNGMIYRGAIGGLSVGYGVDKEFLTLLIDYCITLELLHETSDGIFSKRMLEHKSFRNFLSQKGLEGANKRWKNGGAIGPANAKERKGKESKGKESKSFPAFEENKNHEKQEIPQKAEKSPEIHGSEIAFKRATGLSNCAEGIYQEYADKIRPGAKQDALRAILKLLAVGKTEEMLKKCIFHYEITLKRKEDDGDRQFRIQANNFFGRAARYEEFIDAPYESPAQRDKRILAEIKESCRR